ncbi:MAG: 50S ribosomal protein L3 [Candidatus Woesearchaeota archaeon]
MGKARNPRHGSMQFWPRKRAQKETARIRSWSCVSAVTPLAFAGYKVGMTQVQYKDESKHSSTKGLLVSTPVTIIEVPPLKVMGIRYYNQGIVAGEVWMDKFDKHVQRTIDTPKAKKQEVPAQFDDVYLLVHTQPSKAGFGKKRPEIFEVGIGGTKDQKVTFAQEHLGKDVSITQVFEEGEVVDVHAVTKGKGFQGPVKRFGVAIRHHKSEKTKRGPGSLGGWKGQAHIMYRVAHAGQMGYHLRTTYNQPVLKIGDQPEDVNVEGGFGRYGLVKSSYILVKGSVHGPKKRLITLCKSIRGAKKSQVPKISNIVK